VNRWLAVLWELWHSRELYDEAYYLQQRHLRSQPLDYRRTATIVEQLSLAARDWIDREASKANRLIAAAICFIGDGAAPFLLLRIGL
jgi:hypothetical protein